MEAEDRVLVSGRSVKNGELRLGIEPDPNPGWMASIRLELLPDDIHARLTRDGAGSLTVQLTAALQPADGPNGQAADFLCRRRLESHALLERIRCSRRDQWLARAAVTIERRPRPSTFSTSPCTSQPATS